MVFNIEAIVNHPDGTDHTCRLLNADWRTATEWLKGLMASPEATSYVVTIVKRQEPQA